MEGNLKPRPTNDEKNSSLGPMVQAKGRKQKKASTFDNPPPFVCINCDRAIELTGQVKLFCSEICSEEAKFVRYFRRCSREGRIKKADVQEAVEIRFAHIMAGGYPARERQ